MILRSIIIAAIFFAISFINAFSANSKEIKVQTNLHCESCAAKIEKGLKKISGVLESKADVGTKIVNVKFDSDKTNEKNITTAISDLGYKADLVNKKDDKCCDSNSKKTKSSGKDCCDTKATKSAPKK